MNLGTDHGIRLVANYKKRNQNIPPSVKQQPPILEYQPMNKLEQK